jgi:hypothetical protein
MDPRVRISASELQRQFEAASAISRRQAEISEAQRDVKKLLSLAQGLRPQVQNNAGLLSGLDSLIQKAEDIAGPAPGPYGVVPTKPENLGPDLGSLAGKFARIFSAVNNGDAAPTVDAMRAFEMGHGQLQLVMAKWRRLITEDLPAVNSRLQGVGLAPIVIGK